MNLLTFLAPALAAVVTVVHYQALRQTSRLMHRWTRRPALVLVGGVLAAMVAHVIEILIFAAGYFYCLQRGDLGALVGQFDGSGHDCFYFSFVTYAAVGYGDITPDGPMRFLATMEALTGLVMLAFTASFLFVEMQRYWVDARANADARD